MRMIFAATAAALMAVPAVAETLVASDFNGHRSFWMPGFVTKAGVSTSVYRDWSADDATFEVDDVTGDVLYSGRATNLGDSALQFDFAIELDYTENAGQEGYCQYGGAKIDCPGDVPVDEWSFYTFSSAILTGLGAMEGITASLSDHTNGVHLPQAGIGANAFDKTEPGFSAWFNWVVAGFGPQDSHYVFASSAARKHGDINIDLSGVPGKGGVSPVPLPAGLPLLIAGLGGLGLASRRKRA